MKIKFPIIITILFLNISFINSFAQVPQNSTSFSPYATAPTNLKKAAVPSNYESLAKYAFLYARFREDINNIQKLNFTDGAQTEHLRNILYSYDPEMLNLSWITFCTKIMYETPGFQQEVIKLQKKMKLENIAFDALIRRNPDILKTLPSYNVAIKNIIYVSANDSRKINTLSSVIMKTATNAGRTNWGQRKLLDGDIRIARSLDFGNKRNDPSNNTLKNNIFNLAGLNAPISQESWNMNWALLNSNIKSYKNDNKTIFLHIGRMAALHAIGRLNEKTIVGYTNTNRQCMSFAYLTLSQCISASFSSYEELFCLAEHGVGDISGCVSELAN